MSERILRWNQAMRRLAVATLIGLLTVSGCGKKSVPVEQANSTPEDAGYDRDKKQAAPNTTQSQEGKPDSFDKATRGGDDPPPNSNPPPDVTLSGKPVYKIYKEVLRQWDSIPFATPEGKPIHYAAIVETDFGNIEITLLPELAPNHVRNFVALAQAGYYDGLLFDRICHEEEEVEPGKMQVLDSIEAGCPLGTGEPGNGSIGYWLKPEFAAEKAKITHEPGTVGACHGIEADTAACRFYITLCNAPFLDGNFTVFGKVSQGLDVAHIIAKQPVRENEEDVAGSYRPSKPITIRKVTIHKTVGEAGR